MIKEPITIHYKGYSGHVEFDAEASILFGKVIDIKDAITFQGKTVREITQAFHDSVDAYLAFCKNIGEDPERPQEPPPIISYYASSVKHAQEQWRTATSSMPIGTSDSKIKESEPQRDSQPQSIYWRRRREITVTVNGRQHRSHVEPRLLLVHYLREMLDLTGTHIGCDTSQCGACVVLLNGDSVKACTVLAVQADGCEVTTIEGLGSEEHLHPIQEGFWEKHGLQCGFCTPGMIMASYQILKNNPNPTEAEIRKGLEGNICRCTGYQNIVRAVQYAAERMRTSTVAQVGKGGEWHDWRKTR